jgi:integrase
MATRTRHQTGQIIERSGVFYCRYYTTELVGGKVKRTRLTTRLCVKDPKHPTATSAAVKRLRDECMMSVNREAGAPPRENARDITVDEFWEKTYLPWATENLRASTVFGYTKLWQQVLQPHFKRRTLRDYTTPDGSQFLSGLTKRLGKNSLQHVRSLASGIFTHALNVGLLTSNPWHDVKILTKVRQSPATAHYTLEKAEDIITALVDRVDGQAVFALAFFLGLRPSEIAGLRWEDVDAEWLHVRRAAVRGVVGVGKTPQALASLPLIQPVRGLLGLWREKCGGVTSGWVFPDSKNGPLNVESFCRNIMQPACEAAKLEWRGLYAARRGAGTVLTALTGDALAAMQVLRHKSIVVTANHYIKPSAEAGMAGLKLLEAKAEKKE